MYFNFILIFSLLCSFESFTNHAVTCQLNQGRFGDHLKTFISAAWFSHLYNIPFLYPHFPYCDDLCLDSLEQYDPQKHTFEQIIKYSRNFDKSSLDQTKSTLVIIPFRRRIRNFSRRDIDFRKKMQRLIAPKHSFQKISLPENRLSVAIHVRTGGSFAYDLNISIRNRFRLKFAPFHYYVDQINYLSTIYPDKNLYVHLFTDDQYPERIIHFLEENVSNKNILYGFRNSENSHDKNVLEDFFALMQFDVIIRPSSGFSGMAAYLGRNSLEIEPTRSILIDKNTWRITRVRITKKCNGIPISSETISYRW